MLAVFLLFAGYGFVRAPIPGVNEPHYLAKARHVWDGEWCRRDLFLNSTNAHAVFLWVFGLPASVLPLETVAVIGRVVVWLCLAAGWCRLGSVLLRVPLATVAAAGVFLGLSAVGSLSGEWIIGGVEGKGFAWAALWLGIADLLQGQGRRAALWLGLSVSWHPIIGVWGSIACLGAGIAGMARPDKGVPPTLQGRLQILIIWLLAASPGLIPAVVMLQSADPALSDQANRIQVVLRLGHHLDPQRFSAWSWSLTGAELLVLCPVLIRQWRGSPEWRVYARVLGFAVLIALAGLMIGFGPRWFGLMKFYSFRLLDGLLPSAVGFGAVAALNQFAFGAGATGGLSASAQASARSALADKPPVAPRILSIVVGATAFITALMLPSADRRPVMFNEAELQSWISMCRWISQATPEDALFVTPNYSYAFKWYADRAEYVCNKDMPQDAAGLVEWQRRRNWMFRWRAKVKASPSGYSPEELKTLHKATGAEYLVALKNVVRSRKPVYANEHFAVFRLDEQPVLRNAPAAAKIP